MNINDMTIGEAKEIKAFLGSPVSEKPDIESVFVDSIGKYALLMCLNYNYYGKIESITDGFIKISDAHIVYETGAWDSETWEDAQKLRNDAFINASIIESWHEVKK